MRRSSMLSPKSDTNRKMNARGFEKKRWKSSDSVCRDKTGAEIAERIEGFIVRTTKKAIATNKIVKIKRDGKVNPLNKNIHRLIRSQCLSWSPRKTCWTWYGAFYPIKTPLHLRDYSDSISFSKSETLFNSSSVSSNSSRGSERVMSKAGNTG